MKSGTNLAIFGAALLLLFGSCTKADKDPDEQSGITIQITGSAFTWTLNGSDYYPGDSAFAYSSINSIYAYRGGLSNAVEVNLSSLNPGSYTISTVTGNGLSLVKSGVTYTASGGVLTISSDADNKLSGNLSASFTGTTITSLNAQFNDMPKR